MLSASFGFKLTLTTVSLSAVPARCTWMFRKLYLQKKSVKFEYQWYTESQEKNVKLSAKGLSFDKEVRF